MKSLSISMECHDCGSSVAIPANYCDMCGMQFEENTMHTKTQAGGEHEDKAKSNIRKIKRFITAENKELALRIGIPTLVIIGAVIAILSKNPFLHELILWISPILIGTIVGAANIPALNSSIERFSKWLLAKLATVKDKGKKRHKYFFKPWHWLLYKINNLEEKIEHPQVRNGFKIAAYLYICSLMFVIAYISISLIVLLIMVGVVFWLIDFFSGNESTTYTVRRKEKYVEPEPEPVVRTCQSCSHYQNKDWSTNEECSIGHKTEKFNYTSACGDYEEQFTLGLSSNYCADCVAYSLGRCEKGNLVPESGHACEGFVQNN